LTQTATLDSAIAAAVDGVRPLSRLKPETDWLRADFATLAKPSRVDRAAGIIYGRVVAQRGVFKSRRGRFTDKSLERVVELGNAEPAGLTARWTHPTLSADGLGNFLGRDRNFRVDGDLVRADLHFNKTAMEPPPGGGKPRAHYLMDLVESDPSAVGSSLALKSEKLAALGDDGTPKKDDTGEPEPAEWIPTHLHACDVVDDGDAVHTAFLSGDPAGLPDGVVRQAAELLNSQFAGCDRATVRARATAWLSSYLDLRFGDDDMSTPATEPKPGTEPKPTTEPKPDPKPPADAELAARLTAYDGRVAALEKEREREQLATRTRTVDALFDRWESRTTELGRPDPMVTPDESKRNSETPNLRSLLLTAAPDQFDALTAMVERRPAGLFRGFFAEKVKQGDALAAEPPEVAYAKKFAERENKMARR
jgi:hypothetical protein